MNDCNLSFWNLNLGHFYTFRNHPQKVDCNFIWTKELQNRIFWKWTFLTKMAWIGKVFGLKAFKLHEFQILNSGKWINQISRYKIDLGSLYTTSKSLHANTSPMPSNSSILWNAFIPPHYEVSFKLHTQKWHLHPYIAFTSCKIS